MLLFRRFRILRTEKELPAWIDHLNRLTLWLTALALALFVCHHGYRLIWHGWLQSLVTLVNALALGLNLADILLNLTWAPSLGLFLRRRWYEILFLGLIVFSFLVGLPATLPAFLRLVIVSYRRFSSSNRFTGVSEYLRVRPARTLALSFAVLIALGTFLLTFPAATVDGRGTPLLDSLFTATSAVCVTGLVVRDTATYFSRFGQWTILTLLQLGGLGIMTFSASIIVLLRRRLGPGERSALAVGVEDPRDIDITAAVRYVLLFTLLAEATGTLILFLRWAGSFSGPLEGLFHAVFHSISAFCNAGFSTFSDSLVRWQGDLIVNLAIGGLVVFGGLGFGVVHELVNREMLHRRPTRLLTHVSTHTWLVLRTSALLIIFGSLAFFFFEYDGVLVNLPLRNRLLAALFQAITPRTAGFNTVPLDTLRPVTMLLLVGLMFVGASPGGTGGGIKTTTLAVLWLALRNLAAGRTEVVIRDRTIGRETVYRAAAILVAGLGLVTFFLAILLATERLPFSNLLFETVSAFGTVGLSTGITPALSLPGRLAIIVLMYVGRLGPLTLALTMTARHARLPISYPSARVLVG